MVFWSVWQEKKMGRKISEILGIFSLLPQKMQSPQFWEKLEMKKVPLGRTKLPPCIVQRSLSLYPFFFSLGTLFIRFFFHFFSNLFFPRFF